MLTKDEQNNFKTYLLLRKEKIEKEIEVSILEYDSQDDLGKAVDDAIMQQHKVELKDIAKALSRIENNTYGICERCKEDIHVMRLELKPTTPHCISCREIIEEEG